MTPAELRELAAEARRDSLKIAQHSPGSLFHTNAADAAGARYWLELRADRLEASERLDAARAEGLYDHDDDPTARHREHLGLVSVSHEPASLVTRLLRPLEVRRTAEGIRAAEQEWSDS